MGNTLYITRGLPGSGKTTAARTKIEDSQKLTVRLNRDDFREMMYFHVKGDDKGYKKHLEPAVIAAQIDSAKSCLKEGYDVIIDDTSLTEQHVQRWKTVARHCKAEFVVIDFLHIDPEICAQRDSLRENKVGRIAIYKMANDLGLFESKNKPVDLDENYIVCDLDGTLADITHREDMLHSHDFSWEKFFDSMTEDVPRDVVLSIISDCYPNHPLVIVTARPESYRAVCEKWLSDWQIKYHSLLMRNIEDRRSDFVVKQELIDNFLDKDKIDIWIDDRPSVIAQVRANGIKVCNVGESGKNF